MSVWQCALVVRPCLLAIKHFLLMLLFKLQQTVQQLCITCFKNFRTELQIIKGMYNWRLDSQGSTIHIFGGCFRLWVVKVSNQYAKGDNLFGFPKSKLHKVYKLKSTVLNRDSITFSIKQIYNIQYSLYRVLESTTKFEKN